ncbi:hypothetical protein HerbRD11066_37700 [Herbidospora sp. RD11066]
MVIVVGMFTLGAQAAPDGHRDTIRYASVKGCGAVPCGDWRLVTHHGRVVPLKEAQVRPLDEKGKPLPVGTVPLTVGGDGTKAAYFRKSGQLAVRTFGGPVKVLPESALPAEDAQAIVSLKLSGDGATLAITNWLTEQTGLYDTTTGRRLGLLPKAMFLGFSGDGEEVLVDNDDKLVVYDLSGRLLGAGHRPPDAIVDARLDALHANSTKVAVVRDEREVVVYDLNAGRVVKENPIKLPKGGWVDALDWTGDNRLTLHVSTKGARITVLEHDVKSGATTVRETYTLLKDTFTYTTCGG